MTGKNLAGRVVVITGGARGIGASTAKAFAEAGAKVAIGDLDAGLASKTAAQVGCFAGGLDVTDHDGFARFLDTVEQTLGPLDVLVNNAGIMPVTALVDEPAESVRQQLAVNIAGVLYGTQHAVRRMRPRAQGHIVNVASAAGKMVFGGVATYTASKFAVVGFTEAAALELGGTGIRFSCVMAGMVNTELSMGLNDHWLLRACEPEEVAAAVVGAVRRVRGTAFVPRRLGAVVSAYRLMPSAVRTRLMVMLGADHQMLDTTPIGRDAYNRRVQRSWESPSAADPG